MSEDQQDDRMATHLAGKIAAGDGPISKDEEAKLRADTSLQAAVYTQGSRIIMTLLAGPSHWEHIGALAIDPEVALKLRRLILTDPDRYRGQSWLTSQQEVVATVIECLWAEFKDWAEQTGRSDLLVTNVDLINAALPADKQIPTQ